MSLAMLRDLDIALVRIDGRRLEVVAEGLTLFGGMPVGLGRNSGITIAR